MVVAGIRQAVQRCGSGTCAGIQANDPGSRTQAGSGPSGRTAVLCSAGRQAIPGRWQTVQSKIPEVIQARNAGSR